MNSKIGFAWLRGERMSSGDCATKALEHFHYLARYAWDRAKEVEALPRGITESLEILCKNVQKIRTLSRDKRLKKIGVFGPLNEVW